ncbi:hypothetical protein ACJ73_01113 [Blastomyces percursus]|uniref:Uncharacterized protein n=1 Tax=Blastomyces percursus TaxID=1658174 RepID=A0A1J9RHN6_9EURO|nr:hypothetical protein ACJ73_01113 [Blastomyces percursus]
MEVIAEHAHANQPNHGLAPFWSEPRRARSVLGGQKEDARKHRKRDRSVTAGCGDSVDVEKCGK